VDDELVLLAAAVAALVIIQRRTAAAPWGGPPPGAAPDPAAGGILGAAPDPADQMGTAACIVGTTAAGLPILASGCAPVVRAADGALRQIPSYVYAANPSLVLLNPSIGVDKVKDFVSDVGKALPWNW
jgi:hypothetical protein